MSASTMDRRTVMAGGVAGGLALVGTPAFAARPSLPSKRPALRDRNFTSRSVEREIARVSARIGDPKLRWMFGNCYPNTLDTTGHDGAPVHGRRAHLGSSTVAPVIVRSLHWPAPSPGWPPPI